MIELIVIQFAFICILLVFLVYYVSKVGKLEHVLEIQKYLYSHDKKKAVSFDALTQLLGEQLEGLPNVCEHLEPKNLRAYLDDATKIYLTLESGKHPPEIFEKLWKEEIADLKKEYHLNLQVYGVEAGQCQAGVYHLDMVLRCPTCAKQINDVAIYHANLHRKVLLKEVE
jgi:sulfatase maturation enzyme AslB (radical SAM superfamily)